MREFVEQGAVVRLHGFKQLRFRHTDLILERGIAGTFAAMVNRRTRSHFRNDAFAFLNALEFRFRFRSRDGWRTDSFALSDIEDAVIAKKRDALFLALGF